MAHLRRTARSRLVDNSDFSATRLTALLTLLILVSQGSSPCFPFETARILMTLHVFVFLLVVCLLLSLALLWRLDWLPLRPSSSRAGAKHTTLHRLLKPRSPDDCPACRLASTASSGEGPAPADVAPLVRGQKPARSPQTHRHCRLRLSQPAVPLLWQH